MAGGSLDNSGYPSAAVLEFEARNAFLTGPHANNSEPDNPPKQGSDNHVPAIIWGGGGEGVLIIALWDCLSLSLGKRVWGTVEVTQM